MRLILFLFLSVFLFGTGIHDIDIVPEKHDKRVTGIKILDQKNLSFKSVDGVKFSEISDLAYDKASRVLYMVSDEGKLFHFSAHFSDKIDTLTPLRAVKIRKKSGKAFKKWRIDTEGMCLGSKGGVLISFEGKPKLGLFGYDGRQIKKYALPKKLRDPENYRSKNKALEALARHPVYGALMAAEWPLKKDHKKKQTVYALSGKKWHFRAEPEARSSVTAIEVMEDGNLLVLERSFVDFMEPMVITLKKVYLAECRQNTICKSEVVIKMNSYQGWDVDNFEGLARVDKKRYLMVSDDNDNFFQRTLLVYFEVTE